MLPPGSAEVGPPAPAGEGRPHRHIKSLDHLASQPEDKSITVLANVLARSARMWPDKPAVGWRELKRMIKETKMVDKTEGGKTTQVAKEWSYYELSEYHWWTYKQLADKVKDCASALVETGHSKDTIFNIYSATTKHWQLVANACASQSVTFATAYDSLGEDGLRHSINEPKVYGLFTNAGLLGTVSAVVDRTPSLKVLVYDGKTEDIKAGALDKIRAAHDGAIKVYTLDEFLALGQEKPHEPNLPQPEDVATIMYTSGSTGDPKGVMITNANVIADLAGIDIMLEDILSYAEHQYIAYLPLAHILEYSVELVMLYKGIPMGYAGVKTLTDTSVRNCNGDIRELAPTIMVGVPAVWQLISKGIQTKVAASGYLKHSIFNAAYALKKFAGPNSLLGKAMDAIVFNAVKSQTGGRLLWGISGGAALSQETQEYLSTVLVPVIQGWGLTETTALSCVLHPDYLAPGRVGHPVPSCEIKLVDFAEANYLTSNDPPEGEIYLRGNSITKGYFNRPDLTAEAWTEDGWHKSGDIGRWNKEDGTLSIIDRAKNLIKLSGGEYIAVEHLESIYKNCTVVSNICVHATSDATKPMAIVFPQEAALKKLAGGNGSKDLKQLCEDKDVRAAVLSELNAMAKKNNLKPMETLQTVILTSEEWTPQNGFLTAAQKLQRKKILAEFKDQVDKVYP